MADRAFTAIALESKGADGSRPHGVCLEVPVTVQGLPGPGSMDPQESFFEETRTLVVHAHGAVVRLSANPKPSQKVILTNVRMRQEVICRVLPQRNGRDGYAELEFTQQLAGFWGITFPSERLGRLAPAAGPMAIEPLKPAPPPPAPLKLAEVAAAPETAMPVTLAPGPPAPLTLADVTGAPVAAPPKSVPPLPPPIEAPMHRTERASMLEAMAKAAPPAAPKPAPVPAPPTPRVAAAAEKLPLAEPVHKGFDTPTKPIEVPAALRAMKAEPATAHPTVSAPVFSSALETKSAKSNSRTLILAGAVMAGLVLVAAAGYLLEAPPPAAVDSSAAPQATAEAPAATAAAPADASQGTTPDNSATSNPATSPATTSPAATTVPAAATASAGVPAKTAPNVSPTPAPANAAPVNSVATENLAAAPAPARKQMPSTRIAAPLVNPNRAAEQASVSAPDIATEAPAVTSAPPTGGLASPLPALTAPQQAPAAPVRVGGQVQMPKLRSSVAPLYPAMARQGKVQGNVVIEATIDANGKVSSMRVVSGPAMLQQAAMNALKQWQYEPARLNGQPTSVQLLVTIQFRP